jgi:2-polyprenyl-6-methoxyphenol hydroxylase-like FAD-dependent oxidoreductase
VHARGSEVGGGEGAVEKDKNTLRRTREEDDLGRETNPEGTEKIMTNCDEDAFDVVIAGAGPTGLMLACELALAGVRAVVLERQPARPVFCRGFNLNARSLELLDRRGLAERFVKEGWLAPFAFFGGLDGPLGITDLGFDRPHTLGIPQTRTEELLEEIAVERGVPVRRGHEVIGVSQETDAAAVTVRSANGKSTVRGAYLVGCDGGRSTVRKCAGIGFPGTPSTRYGLLGDVSLADPASLPFGSTRTALGSVFVIPRPGYVRVIAPDPNPPEDRDAPVTLDELQAAVRRLLGRDVVLTNPRWLTRFGDAARQAERYVSGRVILAGDAAHIHPPAGAQGLNVGIQDAFNLGWKLAGQVQGWAPPDLLETYHTERHAAGARVLFNTRAQIALEEPGERFDPLRKLFNELAQLEPVRRYLAEMVTGVATHYDLDQDSCSPLVGRLTPDDPLTTAEGPSSVARLLHRGRGVLLDLADQPEVRAEAAAWSSRVDSIAASIAESSADRNRDAINGALLIRPDGYTAWHASAGTPGLRPALARWFGPAES